jgi:ABC-2 type transport system permease protein
MLKKEIYEFIKMHKILIVPISFIFLMVSQPIAMKLLPKIIKNELPKDAVIHIPIPSSAEVLSTVFGKFESLGVIILILISMGAIAGEREKGVAAMVLTKPINRTTYFISKWTAYSILTIISFIIGMIVTIFYTVNLFNNNIDLSNVTFATALYIPIILLVNSISLFFSSFVKSPILSGFLSFVVYLIVMKTPQFIFTNHDPIFPNDLITNANNLIIGNSITFLTPLIVVIIMNLFFIIMGSFLLNKQEI